MTPDEMALTQAKDLIVMLRSPGYKPPPHISGAADVALTDGMYVDGKLCVDDPTCNFTFEDGYHRLVKSRSDYDKNVHVWQVRKDKNVHVWQVRKDLIDVVNSDKGQKYPLVAIRDFMNTLKLNDSKIESWNLKVTKTMKRGWIDIGLGINFVGTTKRAWFPFKRRLYSLDIWGTDGKKFTDALIFVDPGHSYVAGSKPDSEQPAIE